MIELFYVQKNPKVNRNLVPVHRAAQPPSIYLQDLMKAQSVSKAALALYLGLTEAKAAKFIHGEYRFTLEWAERFGQIFHVEPNEFVTRQTVRDAQLRAVGIRLSAIEFKATEPDDL